MTLISNQLACLLVLLSNQGPLSGTGAESAEPVSALFAQRDQNRDGIWTRSELKTPDDVLAFLAADHNGDFRIPLAEFLVSPAQPSNALWKAFRVADANRNDSIDRKEFVPADGPSGVVEAAEAEFTRHDRDENGRLDVAEYLGCGRSALSHDARFLWMDANEDGRIVLGELAALYPKSQEIHARLEWWFCSREKFADIGLEDWRRRDWKRIRMAADEFWLRDADRDGKLTLVEFAGWEFGVVKPATRQTFAIFDFDQNQTLSLDEFKPIPGATPESERTVPDPILIAYETVSEKMMAVLRATSLESWTESTWPTKQLAGIVEPLQLRAAALWDLDKNGKITPEEVRYCLRGAFGLETWTTPPHSLRQAQSLVFNQNYYDSLDQDHDGRMSREEFVNRYQTEPEKQKGEKEFVAIDANADGFIDLGEVLSGRWFSSDAVSEFTRLDLDLDGRVDPQEFDKQSYPWHQSLKAFVFPAFDQNGDGFLSLMEFRETPAANQLTEWFRAHQDQDGSGTLTFDEFAPPPPGTHPLKLALLRQFMFGRFDRDSDHQLDSQEFPFSINLAALTAEAAFQFRDKDRNGGVSWEELSAGLAAERQPALRQLFVVFDTNENRQLELAEFVALPDVVKPADRNVPDSVRDERDRWLASLTTVLRASDVNRDGKWTMTEWPAEAVLLPILREPATLPLAVWDFDKNGTVTTAELEIGADLAFGFIDPLERKFPWRMPDGSLFHGSNWGALDSNRDGAIPRAEFLANYWEKGEAAEKQFRATDRDGDGTISAAEMFTAPWMQAYIVGDFLMFDADRDGKVSRNELVSRVEEWRKNLGDLAFPAFDKNNDGQLTLAEYRLAQIGNPMINWGSAQADQNGDGVLELAEFYPERAKRGALWLCGFTAFVFDRFDRNADLRLDADEFTFTVNVAALTAKTAFQYRDKDHSGAISWEELSAGQAAERLPALRQSFVVFDANENRQLELAEFLALPDVVKPADRIVPDSVRDERDRWLVSMKSLLVASDANRDGQWTIAEWPASSTLARVLKEAATTSHQVWDFDKDGIITGVELESGADLAFGLIDPLERKHSWRTPDGAVFNGSNWGTFDRNRDGSVTREEFLASYWEKGEAAEKQFRETDRDSDGTISSTEMFTSTWMRPNVVSEFLMFDADRNGKVSREELAERVEPWRKNLGDLAFPAFDKNNDGQLTLAEYRLAQISNPVINWGIAQADQNGDAVLELAEFYPERTQRGALWLCGLMASLFDRFDRNADLRLDADEYTFGVNLDGLTAEAAFRHRDKDRNEGVSWEELSARVPAERQPALRQLFVVFDANENQQLELAEFVALPDVVKPADRNVPDSVRDERNRWLASLTTVLRASDINRDGQWTTTEWPAEAALLPILREPTTLPLAVWDFDKNGTVTAAELGLGADLAFGLIDPLEHKFPWRMSNGAVFGGANWGAFDRNRDGTVTREEFLGNYWEKGETAEKQFRETDRDGDGTISAAEMFTTPWMQPNVVSDFLMFDADRDGKVSRNELVSRVEEWRKNLGDLAFPAFDKNGDGQLTLAEYRLAQISNPVINWGIAQVDQNADLGLDLSEFYPERTQRGPLWLCGLMASVFDRFDRNSDRRLEADEFTFSVNVAALTAKTAFQYRDKDHSSTISLEELTAGQAAERQPALRQLFVVFDANENHQLELAEFLALPDVVKPADRIVPDSVRDERNRWLASLTTVLRASDINRDGQWTTTEWPAEAVLLPILREPATVSMAVWDFDKNGTVTAAELGIGADLAFGFIDPLEHKFPWRMSDGVVFGGRNWNALDRNHDGAVTREEFLANYWEKGDLALKQFQATDRDGDGTISAAEMFTTPWMQPNIVGEFFHFDADRDGRVSREELAARVEPWRKNLGDLTFPAFDKNNDGQLSLAEYRLAQIGNPVTDWGSAQTDRNGDGVLELAEFYPERAQRGALWLCGITASVFDRFDRNADRRLDADEYTFSVNLAALTAQAAFRYRDKDRNGGVSLEELSSGQAAERQPALRQLFVVFDANENQQLELAEFVALPDVVKPADRNVPDSVRDERDRWLASLTTVLRASDVNRDGKWTMTEWPAEAVLLPILREPATLPLAVWDFDKNGTVTAAELGIGADLAFGFIDPLEHKFPWRMSDGVVFGGRNWNALDRNHDGAVTREEFLANYWEKGEAAEKQFQATDRDGDGTISAAEMFTAPWMQPNIVGEFFHFDADRDGRVSREELAARVEPWRKNVGDLTFPAFDNNNDGQLTLAEYRLAQIGNPAIDWGSAQVDQNGDAVLELAEFYPERAQRGALWLCGITAFVFDRFDRNADRRLDADEYTFSVNLAALTAQAAFRYRDKDRNGGVSWEELSTGVAAERQPALRQLFVVFDANENRQLELAEFLALPDVVKPADRIVPDSVRDERDRWLASLTTVLRSADANRDGNWTVAEWPTAALLPLLRNQATASHQVWDTDKDGNITSAELESGANLAFGLIDPLERKHPWRMPDGSVFNGSNWGAFDRNRDGAVTREEFLGSYWEKGDVAAKQFQETDRDGDGTISSMEMFTTPWMQSNVIGEFFHFDADRNGRVSREELASRVETWRKGVGALSFPGFDTNGDGQLTLAEYRLTPISNPITNWASAQTDRNGDGMLDELEFLSERGPFGQLWLCGLAPVIFRRLDTNGDGYLNDTEFEFQGKLSAQLAGQGWGADPVRIACDATVQQFRGWLAIHDLNRDGQLSQNEWPHTEIEQAFPLPILRAFATWDGNMDGRVSVEEFQNALRGAWGITSRRCPLDWLRRGTGHVVDFNTFTTIDEDANGYLSSHEFLERFYGTPVERAKWFPEIDRDHDGSLSLREMLLSGHLMSAPWDSFQRFDSNQDGKLSPIEISGNAQSWQKTAAAMCFPTFDDDRDGLLSPAEYRWSPLANPLVNWTHKPTDTDKDGNLDIDEFYVRPKGESAAWLTLLAFEHFRRLDKNHNGKLALDEFEFSVDVATLDPVAAFQYADKDHDGGLVLAEVFLDAKPDGKNPSIVINYHRSKMRSEEAFLSADVNKDKRLNEAEYQKYHGYMHDVVTPAPRAAGIAPPLATASNRQAPAIPRAQPTRSWEDFLMIGLMGFNLLLAVVGGTYWFMKRRAA